MSKYKHIIERMNQKKTPVVEETKEKEASKMQEEFSETDENLLPEEIDAQSIEDEIRKHWAEKEKQEADLAQEEEGQKTGDLDEKEESLHKKVIHMESSYQSIQKEYEKIAMVQNMETENALLQEKLKKKEEVLQGKEKQIQYLQEKFESLSLEKEKLDRGKELQNQTLLSEKEEEIQRIKMQLGRLFSEREKLLQDKQAETIEKKRLEENIIAIEDIRIKEQERVKALESERMQLKSALEKEKQEDAQYKKEAESMHRKLQDANKALEDDVTEKTKILTEKENTLSMMLTKNQQMEEENNRLKTQLRELKESGREQFLHLFYSNLQNVGTSSCAIDLAYQLSKEEEVLLLDLNPVDAVGLRAYFPADSKRNNGYEKLFHECLLMQELNPVDQKAFYREEGICVFTPSDPTGKAILVHQLLSFLNHFEDKQIVIDISGEPSLILETLLSLQNIHKYFVIQNDDYTAHKAVDHLVFSRDDLYAGWNLVINKTDSVHPRVLDIVRSRMTLRQVISIPEADRRALKREKQNFHFQGFQWANQEDSQNQRRKI